MLSLRRSWCSVAISLLLASCQPVYAQQAPEASRPYRAELTRNVRAIVGLNAPVALFAAQVQQESAWRPQAVSRVGAKGLTQFMPATADWISGLFPELSTNNPFNPSWALRALVRYDDWLHARIRAADECQRWAMVLSAYNGGLGWIARDQKLASRQGLDPLVWFDGIERVNAGRSAANWRENRAYPKRIVYQHQPRYVAWGGTVCL